MPSFYVKREHDDGRTGWVGPIRSFSQALRESRAWNDAGWSTRVDDSTPEIRAEVRAWQKAADIRLGRRRA